MDKDKTPGLIIKAPLPGDYILGVNSPLSHRKRNAPWIDYRPTKERQSTPFFDSNFCTNFGSNNSAEYQLDFDLNFDLVPEAHLKFLKDNGYFDNEGRINFSDTFDGIMSNTSPVGNDIRTVWESKRLNGMIPESMLPFSGQNWAEFADKKKVTAAMRLLGQEFLKYFDVSYEWGYFGSDGKLDDERRAIIEDALQYAPPNIGIPFTAYHLITLEGLGKKDVDIFDHYEPFASTHKISKYPIHFVFRGYVYPKTVIAIKPRTLKKGMIGEDVKIAQQGLITLGFLKGNADGIFGSMTEAAVKAFQKAYKLVADGVYGALSKAMMEDALKKKVLAKVLSPNGEALLKELEGFRAFPYKDSGDKATIGYGSLRDAQGNRVTMSTKSVTKAQATQLLQRDVKTFEEVVNRLVTRETTQNQFDALICFIYNLGEPNLKRSALLKNINAGNQVTKRNFTDWKMAGGKVIPGLITRREKEYALFIS